MAQDAPSAPNVVGSEAQAQFERGVAAYDEGRFRDAVELFKEADRLAPSALLSFNIGKVYERMGDNRSALAAYRDYLRRLPSAENQAEVSGRVAELEGALAKLGVQQLTVLSTPVGATVFVDEASRGITPWTGELTPGSHHLSLRLREYQDSELDITLPAQHAIDVTVQLEAVSAATSPAIPGASGEVAAPSGTESAMSSAAASPTSDVTPLPNWWTWALFGGAAVSFAGAVGFELSRSDMEEAAESPIQIVHDDKYQAMERRQTAARVFLGVGIATALAGGVSLYFDLAPNEESAGGVAFGCDGVGCQLGARGTF